MNPTPQRIRRQRRRLALAAVFFTALALGLLVVAAGVVGGSFLWRVLFG